MQGAPGQESAGYHGYWITDFTRVDPHFGTNAEFKALVDAAHAEGSRSIMDIIANHTADVIQYRGVQECNRVPVPEHCRLPLSAARRCERRDQSRLRGREGQ